MSSYIQKAIFSLSDLAGAGDLPLFEGIMDAMHDGAMIVDMEDRIIYVNKTFCEITGYDRSELIGHAAADLLLQKDFAPKIQEKIKDREELLSDNYEIILTRKDGEKIWVRISASPITDENNKVVGSLGLHEDITERKQNEIILNNTLKEKALLLQETHHRVKNNMQIISSLMSLQAAKIRTTEDAKRAFITCQKRIKAIAVLHELIYKCDDSGQINFNKYCEKIVDELSEGLGLEDQKIILNQESSIGKMGMENALTCGMLINELVINSVEHAFDENGGSVNITVNHKGKNTVLVVKDDGRGVPEGFNLTSDHSLGLLLVGAFVEQLDGSIDVQSTNGARFIITFPT